MICKYFIIGGAIMCSRNCTESEWKNKNIGNLGHHSLKYHLGKTYFLDLFSTKGLMIDFPYVMPHE